MTLQVYNRHNDILCTYNSRETFPTLSEISSMQSAEYIFRIDGKKVSAKKLKEILKNEVIE